MKATVLTDNLRAGLGLVNHAVSSRNQLPVLLNFLIQAKKGELTFSATDLEIGISVNIPAKVEEEGDITVPAKTLFDLVSNITEEKLTFSQEDGVLNLRSDRLKTSFATIPSSEFPKLFEEKGEKAGSIKREDFRLLSKVVIAAADELSARPELSGVLLSEDGQGLEVVATDGYRLSLLKNFSLGTKKPKRLLLPARVIRELLSQKNPLDTELFVSEKGNQVVFDQGETIVVGRLIEGNFPEYGKIIPQDFSTVAIFDRDEAQSAVKACSVFAREAANIIRISLQKEKIVFSSDASSVGTNEISIDAKVEGEENEIAFNSRYLMDAFSVLKEGSVRFEMTGPLNPGVFKEEGNKNFLHIIMPIKVTN